jgi:hypothetical protein
MTMDVSMHVGRCVLTVSARVCLCVLPGWCLQVELPTVQELESQPALGAAWHRRYYVNLAPDEWRARHAARQAAWA